MNNVTCFDLESMGCGVCRGRRRIKFTYEPGEPPAPKTA